MTGLLRELCSLPGVSGREERVREAILAHINGHCDARVDALGNIIAHKQGARRPKRSVMFSAHMDEVGLIVTAIESDGLLRFSAVGGVEPAVLVGKHVLVGDKLLPGVIGVKPIHLCEKDERESVPKIDALAIDIGASDAEEARGAVRPGDCAVFGGTLTELGTGCLCGRALDDRVGCAILIELLRSDLPCDCTCVFTVQEEMGCAGAQTAAWSVAPDIAVALETTTAGDLPGAPADKTICRLGDGPVLSFMDKGTIYDSGLFRAALGLADEIGARCQVKEGVTGANEMQAVQTAGAGVRTLALSVPCRYLHSPSCLLRLRDIDDTIHLLSPLLARLALHDPRD